MSIYSERLLGVQDKIRKTGLEAAVICEPTSIRYLLNRNFVHVGERLMALAVPKEGKSILFINRLFPVSGDESFDVVYHDDTDIATEGLARFLPSGKIGIDRFLYSQFLIQLLEQRNDIVPKVGSYVVEELRMIKGEDEKELMRRASALNDEIIAKVPGLIRPGMTELELADLLIAEYKKVGEPWAPLVGFGPGAADPHHVNSDTVISPGVVLVDAGQETNGYFSDMTRTFFYKEVSEEERKVYEIVKEANRRGKAAVKPGVRFCDVDAAARDYITEMGYGEYFTHRLGHNIGMQLHEEPSVSASNTGTVEEGMTFSIEPGIYLPGKFGVRIEDLVLVTKDGCEVLNSYPREIQIIG
jgi:Xaa-Pro dipeptidase